jgi:MFS family permease
MGTSRISISSITTLIAAYLGLFVGLIDANAVNLALPAIRADLGGGISGAQWTIDAYNVAFAAVLLTAGSLGDRFGRRALLRFGLITFAVASLACAAAPSLPPLGGDQHRHRAGPWRRADRHVGLALHLLDQHSGGTCRAIDDVPPSVGVARPRRSRHPGRRSRSSASPR